MGMVLFTQSGTFKPSDYGLSAGDALQIVCVGGGGAGGGSNTGGNGSASSFGSIVSAAGGNGGPADASAAAQAFSSQGMAPTRVGWINPNEGTYYPYNNLSPCGGDGGHGWWPYTLPTRVGASAAAALLASGSLAITLSQSGNMYDFVFSAGNISINSTAASAQAGGVGGCVGYYDSGHCYIGIGGAGGIGYGAGGGGAGSSSNKAANIRAGAGGNGGQIITHNLILDSAQVTTSYAITVGAGGTNSRAYTTGGDGANGCVAVFW